jgi:hypothetical protein
VERIIGINNVLESGDIGEYFRSWYSKKDIAWEYRSLGILSYLKERRLSLSNV